MLWAFDPTLIILDLQYAEGDGIEVLSFLKQRGSRVPIMLISGFDARVLESARRVGLEYGLTIVDALEKPLRLDALARVLESYREPESDEWAADLRRGDRARRDRACSTSRRSICWTDGWSGSRRSPAGTTRRAA